MLAQGLQVNVSVIENGLIALQGPKAAEQLAKHTNKDLRSIGFFESDGTHSNRTKPHNCSPVYMRI